MRLSLQEAAEQAGMSPSVLSRIERGQIRDLKLEVAARLGGVLGLSLDELALEAGYLPSRPPRAEANPRTLEPADLTPVIESARQLLHEVEALRSKAARLR